MSFWKSIKQDVVADNLNSSNANINSGSYFIGTAASTLGVAGLQVSLRTNENCTVWVDQAPTNQLVDNPVGTSAATNNSTTITGTGTYFTKNFSVGDTVVFDPTGTNQTRTVASITSDTVMDVTAAFTGGSLSGKSFKLYPWDIRDSFNYYANDNFGITVQAISSYLRVRVYNTSANNTKYLRLQTALCPIVEAVPRTLNSDGNFKSAIYGMFDDYGFEVENTPMGEMRTAQPVRIAGSSYEGNTIDPNFIVSGASGAGAAVSQAGQIIITSGTANAATAYAYSVRRGRYVGGTANRYRSVRRTDAGTANNTRRWGVCLFANYTLTISSATVVAGDVYTNNNQQFTIRVSGTVTTAYAYGTGNPGAGAQTYTKVASTSAGAATLTGSNFAPIFTPTDGAWFQYTGTVFGVKVMNGGSLVSGGDVDTGSFNGFLGTTYTPGITALAYEIYYSNTNVWFSIGSELLHKFSLTTGLWAASPSLYLFSDSVNTGVATSVNMYSRSATIYRLGNLNTENQIKYVASAATTICKYGTGKLKNIIVNNPDAGAQVVTIYDAVSVSTGNTIATLTWGADGNQHAMQPQAIPFDIPFHNGLTVVTSTANPVTIIYE